MKHSQPLKPIVVLLDDDLLVHLTWKMRAKTADIELISYYHLEALLDGTKTMDRATPIYIDSSLGEKLKGEEVAALLSDMGFSEIFLVTGYPPESFGPLKGVKKILGKDPPF